MKLWLAGAMAFMLRGNGEMITGRETQMKRRLPRGAGKDMTLAAPAIGQGLPDRPIKLVSGFAPGGSCTAAAEWLRRQPVWPMAVSPGFRA